VSVTTDEVLMQRLGAGEPQALDLLFRRHHERVHALCARLAGDGAAADDLVQETFLRVLRFARTFEQRARFTTWLYRIARNVCLDHIAQERRRASAVEPEAVTEATGHDARLDVLEQALQRLPETMRAALVLSRFHELPYEELASVLGCSVGAARVRVHRALNELKRLVQELEADDERVPSHS
jgi:RNA polymerase sigma factor (sigma-70 family)